MTKHKCECDKPKQSQVLSERESRDKRDIMLEAKRSLGMESSPLVARTKMLVLKHRV